MIKFSIRPNSHHTLYCAVNILTKPKSVGRAMNKTNELQIQISAKLILISYFPANQAMRARGLNKNVAQNKMFNITANTKYFFSVIIMDYLAPIKFWPTSIISGLLEFLIN